MRPPLVVEATGPLRVLLQDGLRSEARTHARDWAGRENPITLPSPVPRLVQGVKPSTCCDTIHLLL